MGISVGRRDGADDFDGTEVGSIRDKVSDDEGFDEGVTEGAKEDEGIDDGLYDVDGFDEFKGSQMGRELSSLNPSSL